MTIYYSNLYSELRENKNESCKMHLLGKVSFEYSDDILESISGEYSNALDLKQIHVQIMHLIEHQKSSIPLLRLELSKYETSTPHSTSILHKIQKWEKLHVKYMAEAPPILSEYTKIAIDKREECALKRIELIRKYVDLIGRILPNVNIVMNIPLNEECVICGRVGNTNNTGICVCGYMIPTINSRDGISNNKSNYLDCENFQKTLAKYEGIITLDERDMKDICVKLDAYFKSYGKPSGEEIRALPLNERGWKNGTSYELMGDALKAINKPIYDYVPYICHSYWGYKLPDLSSVRNQVIEDYIKTQPVFNHIINRYPELRKSSLNTGFRMFKHLQLRGYPCKEDDFRIVKTYDIRVIHDKLWSIMCECTNLKFIPTV